MKLHTPVICLVASLTSFYLGTSYNSTTNEAPLWTRYYSNAENSCVNTASAKEGKTTIAADVDPAIEQAQLISSEETLAKPKQAQELENKSEIMNDDAIQEKKVLSNIAEYLNIELADENPEQLLGNSDTFQSIEYELMYGDMDADSRIDMVSTYLDAFEHKASDSFVSDLLETSSFTLNVEAQAEMIETVGYYLKHNRAKYDDNYRDSILNSLKNFADDSDDVIRKAAFMTLSRTKRNRAEREEFLASYQNDSSSEIRALAVLIASGDIY